MAKSHTAALMEGGKKAALPAFVYNEWGWWGWVAVGKLPTFPAPVSQGPSEAIARKVTAPGALQSSGSWRTGELGVDVDGTSS